MTDKLVGDRRGVEGDIENDKEKTIKATLKLLVSSLQTISNMLLIKDKIQGNHDQLSFDNRVISLVIDCRRGCNICQSTESELLC